MTIDGLTMSSVLECANTILYIGGIFAYNVYDNGCTIWRINAVGEKDENNQTTSERK